MYALLPRSFIMFVVGRDGRTVVRLPHSQPPSQIREQIESMLAQPLAEGAACVRPADS